MALAKTSVALTHATEVPANRLPKKAETSKAPQVGEERDGLVWDGTQWVPKES